MNVSFSQIGVGKVATLLVLADVEEQEMRLASQLREMGFRFVVGRVGSMNADKIVAAVETAAKREKLSDDTYRFEHALYHACLDALHGVCRGSFAIGDILRTVGLRFSVVVGPRLRFEGEPVGAPDPWLAVALYGTIGAPVKGWEHEVIGLGVNHL